MDKKYTLARCIFHHIAGTRSPHPAKFMKFDLQLGLWSSDPAELPFPVAVTTVFSIPCDTNLYVD